MIFNYNNNSLKSGIYKITNSLNGRIYIGSAKRFKERWKNHQSSLEKEKHYNKFLQNDYNKCKQTQENDDFLIFDIVEITTGNKEERLILEEKYINEYYDKQKLCYNIEQKAIQKEHMSPEEIKEKKSKIQKRLWQIPEERIKRIEGQDGQRRKKIGEASKKAWATFSKEKMKVISENNKQKSLNMWKNMSEEKRQEFSLRAKENGKSSYKQKLEKNPEHNKDLSKIAANIEFTFKDPKGNIIKIINLRRFCKENNFSYYSFTDLGSKKVKSYKKWTFVSKQKISIKIKPQ